MPSRTQTTEVLLRWKYVRQAVERALCTLEQFTISDAEIFQYITNTSGGTKTTKDHSSFWTNWPLTLLRRPYYRYFSAFRTKHQAALKEFKQHDVSPPNDNIIFGMDALLSTHALGTPATTQPQNTVDHTVNTLILPGVPQNVQHFCFWTTLSKINLF